MKIRYIATLLLLIMASNGVNAQNKEQIDSVNVAQNSKVKFKFGGRIDLAVFADSYLSKSLNRGIYYFYPLAPSINSQGQDLHGDGTLGFGIGATRLNASVLIPNVLGAAAKVYVETDFLGSSDAYFGNLRLRHAYFQLDWKSTQLTFGQTDDMLVPVEAAGNTVTFGGGAPISPLLRLPQIRVTQNLAPTVKLSLAATLASSGWGTMQSSAMTPGFEAKFTVGRTTGSMFGLAGSYRSARPRRMTPDSIKTYQRVQSWSVSAFGLHTFGGGHKLKLFAMWGNDLSQYSMIGGYAPLLSDVGEADYGYGTTSALSAYVDFETRQMNGWQPGVFLGVQKNLGSTKELALSNKPIADFGIDSFWRIAPRLYYYHKGLTFGLEYMYSSAVWAKKMDANYRPTELYNATGDHRVTLLARFTF